MHADISCKPFEGSVCCEQVLAALARTGQGKTLEQILSQVGLLKMLSAGVSTTNTDTACSCMSLVSALAPRASFRTLLTSVDEGAGALCLGMISSSICMLI